MTSTETTAATPRTGGAWDVFVGRGSALTIATVYRCVNLLSDSVAVLPLRYMRMRDGRFVIDGSSRLNYLLNVQPDAAMSAYDFWRQAIQQLLLEGNAYIVPVYSAANIGEVDRLVLCSRGTVSHDVYNNVYTVNDTLNGVAGQYPEERIIHLKGMSLDGKRGLSVLQYARLTMDIATAGDRETLNRFATGGNIRGMVTNDTSVRGFGEYSDKELDKLADDIQRQINNSERIFAMPGQAKFTQFSLSSTDMQFLESRKFSVREICRFFGVHPSFVFDDTSNNYKSAENAYKDFLNVTLNPLLRKIECELLRKLVAPGLAGKRKFEFNRGEISSCDLESRTKYWQQMMASGLYTVNELRAEENKPAVEGGDKVFVSANLRLIEEVKAENNQATPDANAGVQQNQPQDNNDNDNNKDNNNPDNGKEEDNQA